ncbi:MAG TPA: hypothetical protein VIG71_02340 [Enteractinococcus sp.]
MRLYKFEITQLPKTIIESHPGDDIYYHTVHLADPVLRKEWEGTGFSTKDSYYNFFLPSENKLYRSRSSARDKVKAVERWGGKARILEAEVSEFIPVEEANLRRRKERDDERVRKLEEQIKEIKSKYAHAVTLQKLNDMKARMGLDEEAA